jgi:hypothetical protein
MRTRVALSALILVAGLAPAAASENLSTPPAGPLLTVTGTGISPIITDQIDTAPTPADIAAGTLVTYCWTADASAYLGTITAYRYGFDIIDVNDPDAWGVPWTAFAGEEVCSPPLVFFFGTHTFTVEVMDSDGGRSRVPIGLSIIPTVGTQPATWGRIKALYR